MPKLIDLTGCVFGRLKVVKRTEKIKGQRPKWDCICSCGTPCVARSGDLASGRHTSCGCYHREIVTKHGNSGKHGIYSTRPFEYRCWSKMKQRCSDPKQNGYKHYGGRGVIVCRQWIDSFEEFLKGVGYAPSESHSLDRYPNKNGNYEPGNVRWATKQEQNRNKRNNRYLEFDGVSKTVTEWSEITGINKNTLFARLRLGWTIEDALLVPTRCQNK